MRVEFDLRRYRPGDEAAINELYRTVTGRTRNAADFRWQWLDAPGGTGEIWLIEAIAEGERQLIGHHGVMPIRFSCDRRDLLFGKTENTMVLAEWRRRLLYPRYEAKCRASYEHRFDALFSTTGPSAAIRQRSAQGYDMTARWQSFLLRLGPQSEFGLMWMLGRRALAHLVGAQGHVGRAGGSGDRLVARGRANSLAVLDDASAEGCAFFDGFWDTIRARYGVTPSRARADLSWRFWRNPYRSFITLVRDGTVGTSGYAILSAVPQRPGEVLINDIMVDEPTPERLEDMLTSVLDYARDTEIRWLKFTTTSDNPALRPHWFRQRQVAIAPVLVRRSPEAPVMPRRVCARGLDLGLSSTGWSITPIVFEGR